jgi:predicted amidohydrolase YtcJ
VGRDRLARRPEGYVDLLAEGSLTARVRASQWWDRHRGVEQLDDLVAERDRLAAAGLDAGSVKLMMDGIAETYTATVTEPYLDLSGCPCGDRGLTFLPPEQVREAVVALDAAGFAAHFHAIGDRAVHDALDALEAARDANGPRQQRHQVAHLQLVRPEDRRRFGELGVTANVEGMWVMLGSGSVQLLLPHLDGERATWHYPFADIVAGGGQLAGGSDWPVNPPEPLSAVHALVNRTAYTPDGDPGDPLCPEQAVSLETAMAAYTSGSARVVSSEATGRVEVGAVADLAVLDRDPFAGPSAEIGGTRVLATYVGGRLVHAEDDFGS